jgi:glyoxylase-like metal-dependent hydrolase (beta-lactamase superfamily II)
MGKTLRMGARSIALTITIGGLFLASIHAEDNKYAVYAVRFATISNFRVASLVAGADPSRRMDIAMMIWVVRGAGGRVAIVDSGFHRDQYFTQYTVADYIKPSEAITPLGLKADDVTDLIVSHMHWDHAGGIDLFPKARVWIQKEEYEYYTGAAWQARNTHGGIDPDDVLELVKRNLGGLVSLVAGDNDTALPGLAFMTGGKHTWASQFVSVRTAKSTVVLASDNMYLYENLDQHKPIAQTLDAAANLRAQDRMRSLASDPRLVIPGHDPAVFDRFPHVTDRIVRIE